MPRTANTRLRGQNLAWHRLSEAKRMLDSMAVRTRRAVKDEELDRVVELASQVIDSQQSWSLAEAYLTRAQANLFKTNGWQDVFEDIGKANALFYPNRSLKRRLRKPLCWLQLHFGPRLEVSLNDCKRVVFCPYDGPTREAKYEEVRLDRQIACLFRRLDVNAHVTGSDPWLDVIHGSPISNVTILQFQKTPNGYDDEWHRYLSVDIRINSLPSKSTNASIKKSLTEFLGLDEGDVTTKRDNASTWTLRVQSEITQSDGFAALRYIIPSSPESWRLLENRVKSN